MKKILTIAVLAAAMSSFADFSIVWKNENGTVANSGFTDFITDGTYAALLWSATAPAAQTSLNADGTGAGEFLLASTLDTAGGGFVFNGGESVTFGNSNVGDVDINNGYFFTRIFDTAALSDNNYYVQAQITGPALVDAGSPVDPAKVYNQNIFGATGTDGALGQVDTQYTVIPEPATIGLMGVAGLGMFLARRKSRR